MKRLTLVAALLLATPAMAQTAPPGAEPPAQVPDIVMIHAATLNRALTFLQADGGSVANDIGSKLLSEVRPQVVAFQKQQAEDARQRAEADKKAADAKATPPTAPTPAPAKP